MTDLAKGTSGSQVRDGLVAELARVLDALVVTRPGADLLEDSRQVIHRLVDRLEALPTVPERVDVAAHSPDNPRLQPGERGLVPLLHLHTESDSELSGRVVFSPRFAGTGSVHGGALSLFFDDFLGRLANNSSRRLLSRTAYLRTDFRALTPLTAELSCTGWVARTEDRKRILRGTLRHGETVVAEAEGLWVEARPQQKEKS